MKRNYVAAENEDRPDGPSAIGPQCVVTEVDGTTNTFRITPDLFGCSLLAQQLANEWKWKYDRQVPTMFGPQSYRQAIRSFCRFVDVSTPEPSLNPLNLAKCDGAFLRIFFEWERHLLASNLATSSLPNRMPRWILGLIRQRFERGLLVHPTILERTSHGPSFRTPPNAGTLSEFSGNEMSQMRNAARKHIRTLEFRIAEAHAAADCGSDPRTNGWNLNNLLWATRARVINSRDLFTAYGFVVKLPPEMHALAYDLGIALDDSKGTRKWTNAMNVLNRALYAAEMELLPYRVILCYKTGLTLGELTSIRLSETLSTSRIAEFKVRKDRAAKSRTVRYVSGGPDGNDNWSIPSITARLIRQTQPARAEAEGELGDMLWAVHYISNGKRYSKLAIGRKNRLSQWVQENGLQVSKPLHWNRFRKTKKAVTSLIGGSVDFAAGGDHSVQVYLRHYASTESVLTLAGRSIVHSQSVAFAQATAGPTVVSDQSSLSRVEPEVAKAIERAKKQSADERSLTVGSCADLTSPPLAPGRHLCEDLVNSCLECPNSLILEEHLPQVLLLQAHLEHERRVNNPVEYFQKRGQTLKNLDTVLSLFSEKAVSEAKEKVALGIEHLLIPLNMKVELNE